MPLTRRNAPLASRVGSAFRTLLHLMPPQSASWPASGPGSPGGLAPGPTTIDGLSALSPRELLATGLPNDLRHPVVLYLASISPSSRRTQTNALRHLSRFFRCHLSEIEWASLGLVELEAWRAHLVDSFAPGAARASSD